MLSIPLSTIGWIIVKAREFDVKEDANIEPGDDDGDNPLGVLEHRPDDATAQALRSWINDLTDTQKAELVALFWLGRDGEDPDDFPELVRTARAEQHRRGTARYLLGSPLLGDYLEDGLETLGLDSTEIEEAVFRR